MSSPAPPETKVVASAVTGYLISLILQLLQTYVPHFHSPPAGTVALLITTATIITGYLAPHTPRTAALTDQEHPWTPPSTRTATASTPTTQSLPPPVSRSAT